LTIESAINPHCAIDDSLQNESSINPQSAILNPQ
jgi:hypothetical protein